MSRACRNPLALALSVVALLAAGAAFAAAPQPVSSKAVAFGISRPIADISREPITVLRGGKGGVDVTDQELRGGMNPTNTKIIKRIVANASPNGSFVDPTLAAGRINAGLRVIPAPIITFDGVNSTTGIHPPDTVGDVGPNHYVQNTNSATTAITTVAVYNKATGAQIGATISMASLFASLGAGNACAANDDGDPIVLYDSFADRWMISQFAIGTEPTRQCIAISQTGDPTGAYYAYEFIMPTDGDGKLNDYPHFGVWHDAYYMTDNQFNTAGTAFEGAGIFAFDRAKMIAGDPTASYIYFDIFGTDPNAGGLLPTDADGLVPPPPGLPQLVMEYRATEFGDPLDALRIYEFVPNFTTPASSTLTVRPDVALAAFDANQPAGRGDIEQSGGANLDSLSDRLMHRLQYRNMGTITTPQNRWAGSFSVNVSGVTPTSAATYQAAPRWFILQSAGTALPTVLDQGTHSPDSGNGATGNNRWMPSAALDSQGNLGIGFSRSSTTNRADIVIAGRLASDAPGSLVQGEAVAFAALGSQTSTANRWGDYSSMNVDPVDDCTFWYTTEYYSVTSGANWRTRIVSFKYPSCTTPQKGNVAVHVTNCGTGAAIQGATVKMTGGFVNSTNATGDLVTNFTAGPASYTVTSSKAGFVSGPGSTAPAVVTDGSTTNVNVCLTGAPAPAPGGSSITSESCTPANNALDPAEVATVSLCITNNGTDTTTSLVGTLQATGGVGGPSGPQNYGAIAVAATVCRDFTFTANAAACGDSVTATLDLQDGATNLGTAVYTFITGTLSGPTSTVTFSYTGAAVAIPDNSPAGVDVPLVVSGIAAGSAITDMNFRLDTGAGTCDATIGDVDAGIDHTFVGDVLVKLKAPTGGPMVTLIDRIGVPASTFGNGTNNFCLTTLDDEGGFPSIETFASTTLPVSGNFSPSNPLSGFDGFSAVNGTWNVNVSDAAGTDTGSVRRFSLIITTQQRVCSTTCAAPCALTCPANISVFNTPGQCNAPITFAPTATGTCGTVTCSQNSGGLFNVGTTNVTCSSSQGGGACAFDATVVDNEPPVVTAGTCPTINVTSPGGQAVNFTPPSTTDNCSGTVVGTCTPAPGSIFPLGNTTITCTFPDGNQQTNTCSFPLSVTGSVLEIPTLSPQGFGSMVGLLAAAALFTMLRRRRQQV